MGGPLRLSFFLFFLLFSVLFFIPYERVSCPGLGRRFRPLSVGPVLLLLRPILFLLVSFLGVDARRPGSGEIRLGPNKIN